MEEKNSKKVIIGIIIIIFIIIVLAIFMILNNNLSKNPVNSTNEEQDIITKCINNYKFMDEEEMTNKKISIVNKDDYGRYLVMIEYDYYLETTGEKLPKVAFITIYDVKADGTSKTEDPSVNLMGIVGGAKETTDINSYLQEEKEKNNWNKPIK